MEADLKKDIEKQLRTLRAADSQAEAIAWMTKTYFVLERCLEELREHSEQPPRERLVFVPERPKLEIVRTPPSVPPLPGSHRKLAPVWFSGETVVYQEVPVPVPFAIQPKAWTRKDTLRLERTSKPYIQRRGR